jgi:hypothetical protein
MIKGILVEVSSRIVALYSFEDCQLGLHLSPLPENNVAYRIIRIEPGKHPDGYYVDIEDQAGTVVQLGELREDGKHYHEDEEINGGVLIKETKWPG